MPFLNDWMPLPRLPMTSGRRPAPNTSRTITRMITSSPIPSPNMASIIGKRSQAGKLALRGPGGAPILRPLDASDFSDRVRAAASLGREARSLPGQRAWRRPEGPVGRGGPVRALLPGGVRDRTVAPRAADPLRHPERAPRRRRRALLRAVDRSRGAAAGPRPAAGLAREPPPTARL